MRILTLLALAGSLWASPVLAAERPEAQNETPVANAVAAPAVEEAVLSEFAQANPEWGSFRFSGTRTLGAKGCAIFSALIIARLSGGYQGDPLAFTRALQLLEGFDNRGRLWWTRTTSLTRLVAERIRDLRGAAALDLVETELRNGNFAALQLRTPTTREHWVAAIALADGRIVIIDPAGGRRGFFLDRFEEGYVTGVVIFRQLPAPVQVASRTP